MRAFSAFAFAVLAVGCFTPDLGDGAVACGANGACPPRYFCHVDNHCYQRPDDGGVVVGDLASTFDLAGDLAGGDLSSCTKASCGARNCGMILDGCGGVESCGATCPSGQSCGGGGGGGATKMANVCANGQACTPKVCQSKDCGLVSDDCAAVLDCGGCSGGKSCGTGHMCH